MNGTTVEIPRGRWGAAFDDLSRDYQGWRLTVDLLDMDLGDQRVFDGISFLGIDVEVKGSDAGDILIAAENADQELFVHRVDRPLRVRVADTMPGDEMDIQIESAEGWTRLVTLRRWPESSRSASFRERDEGMERSAREGTGPWHEGPQGRRGGGRQGDEGSRVTRKAS